VPNEPAEVNVYDALAFCWCGMTEDPLIDLTRVSEKGQVVIPKEIRDRMGFKEGTKLIVMVSGDAVVLQRVEVVAGKVRMREIMERIKSLAARLGMG